MQCHEAFSLYYAFKKRVEESWRSNNMHLLWTLQANRRFHFQLGWSPDLIETKESQRHIFPRRTHNKVWLLSLKLWRIYTPTLWCMCIDSPYSLSPQTAFRDIRENNAADYIDIWMDPWPESRLDGGFIFHLGRTHISIHAAKCFNIVRYGFIGNLSYGRVH